MVVKREVGFVSQRINHFVPGVKSKFLLICCYFIRGEKIDQVTKTGRVGREGRFTVYCCLISATSFRCSPPSLLVSWQMVSSFCKLSGKYFLNSRAILYDQSVNNLLSGKYFLNIRAILYNQVYFSGYFSRLKHV